MRPSRRNQPYRRGGVGRGPSPTQRAMRAGKTLYGQNPADLKRLATKQAASRRRRVKR